MDTVNADFKAKQLRQQTRRRGGGVKLKSFGYYSIRPFEMQMLLAPGAGGHGRPSPVTLRFVSKQVGRRFSWLRLPLILTKFHTCSKCFLLFFDFYFCLDYVSSCPQPCQTVISSVAIRTTLHRKRRFPVAYVPLSSCLAFLESLSHRHVALPLAGLLVPCDLWRDKEK